MSGQAANDPLADVPDPQAWVAERLAALARPPDPVARRSIDALARRAAAQQGEARRLMLLRLDQWLAHGCVAGGHVPACAAKADPLPVGSTLLADLAALVDRLGRSSPASGLAGAALAAPDAPAPTPPRRAGRHDPMAERDASARTGRPSQPHRPLPMPAQPPALKSVTAFKATWARLRTEQRLRQALNQVPAQAGPLNSSQLVHRALHTLQALSPAYLTAFMAHVETLLWLDQASGGGLPEPKARPGTAAVKSPPPARPATARRPARKRSSPD